MSQYGAEVLSRLLRGQGDSWLHLNRWQLRVVFKGLLNKCELFGCNIISSWSPESKIQTSDYSTFAFIISSKLTAYFPWSVNINWSWNFRYARVASRYISILTTIDWIFEWSKGELLPDKYEWFRLISHQLWALPVKQQKGAFADVLLVDNVYFASYW